MSRILVMGTIISTLTVIDFQVFCYANVVSLLFSKVILRSTWNSDEQNQSSIRVLSRELKKDREGKGVHDFMIKGTMLSIRTGANSFLKADDNEILCWKSVKLKAISLSILFTYRGKNNSVLTVKMDCSHIEFENLTF